MICPTLVSTCAYRIFEKVSSGEWTITPAQFSMIPHDLRQKIFSILSLIPVHLRSHYLNSVTFQLFFEKRSFFLVDTYWEIVNKLEKIDFSHLIEIKITHNLRIWKWLNQIEHCKNLENLSLPFYRPESEVIRSIAKYCINLQSIELRLASPQDLSFLRQKCQKLTSCSLNAWLIDNLIDCHVQAVLENGHPLIRLTLDGAKKVTDAAFRSIESHASTMRFFSIKYAWKLSADWIQRIILKLVNLNHLTLAWFKISNFSKLNDEDKSEKVQIFNLLSLNLMSNSGIPDSLIAELIHKNKRLQICELKYCEDLGNASLTAALNCSALKSLKFHHTKYHNEPDTLNIEANNLIALSILCPELKSNFIIKVLKSVKNLQSLTLQLHESAFTDFESVLLGLEHLESIKISSIKIFNSKHQFKTFKRVEIIKQVFQDETIFLQILQASPYVKEIQCKLATHLKCNSNFEKKFKDIAEAYPSTHLIAVFSVNFEKFELTNNKVDLNYHNLDVQIEERIKNSINFLLNSEE